MSLFYTNVYTYSYQVNLYLITQLETTGLVAISGYVGCAVLLHYLNKRSQSERHSPDDMYIENGAKHEPPERIISLHEAR